MHSCQLWTDYKPTVNEGYGSIKQCIQEVFELGVGQLYGDKEYSCIDAVHNHMCGYFLSVNKCTPNSPIEWDMRVRVPWKHRNVEIARQ